MFRLSVKYAIFALAAIAANMMVQYAVLSSYHGRFNLYAAMVLGTGAGLFIKYILDKRYIFCYAVANKVEDAFRFVLYSLMGVLTTVIFWGTELLFNAFLHFGAAKYIGAFTGLTIGYIAKYHLDKRFVFRNKGPTRER